MQGKKEFIIVFLALTIIALFFFLPIFSSKIPFNGNLLAAFWSPFKFEKWANFSSGVPFKFMGVDEVREFYPLLDFTYDSIKNKTIPLWNPYNFSGYPHLANWASAVFYPLHLSMLIFSKVQTLIFLKISAIILSGFFTYLYLRSILLSKYSSLAGSLFFSLSSTMLVWNAEIWQSAHSFLWLPLAFFSIEKLTRTKKFSYAVLLSLSIALSIIAGYIQPTIYLLILVLAYSLFRTLLIDKRNINNLVKISLGVIIGLGMSGVQLLPGIESYLLSPRSMVGLKELNINFLVPLNQLVTFIVPDFFGNITTQNWFLTRPGQYYENMIYVGLVPLILSFFAPLYKKAKPYFIFFLFFAFVSLSLALDLPTSRMLYDFSVPFLSSAIPIRIVFVLSFAISILGALGLEWWIENSDNKKKLITLLPLLLVFAILGMFLFYAVKTDLQIKGFPSNWYIISVRNSVIPIIVFIFCFSILLFGFFKKSLRKILGLILCSVFLVQSFLFSQKYFSFSQKIFLYPKAPALEFIKENQGLYRYWGYGSASLANNFATVYKIYSPEGYDPVNIRAYNELLSSSRKAKYEGIFSRSDALLYPVADFPFESSKSTKYRIMDLLGVKYIGFEKSEFEKIDKKRLDLERFKKAWEDSNFIVFENLKVYPRVYLASFYLNIPDRKTAINKLYDPSFDSRKTVILSEKIPLQGGVGEGSASIVSYSPNKVEVKVESEKSQIVVLSDAFYPGWKAEVNNKPSKIFLANAAFRGVFVPEGKSNIVFKYSPLSFYLGSFITFFSLIISGVIVFLSGRKHL
ncbi:MAG: YfhO family protein [bacterium]|nr:YfhO family protein [bacterium]